MGQQKKYITIIKLHRKLFGDKTIMFSVLSNMIGGAYLGSKVEKIRYNFNLR